MLKKQILLSITGLSILSLSSLTFSMEKVDPTEKQETKTEAFTKIQIFKKILDNGATITQEDLEQSEKNDPELNKLFKETLEERSKKKKQKEKEGKNQESKKVIKMDEKLEN